MPATIDPGWSVQDVLDVMAHAQTLPTGEAPVIMPETGAVPLSWTYPALLVSGLLMLALGLALLASQRVRRAQ